jgi:hypothetical protein
MEGFSSVGVRPEKSIPANGDKIAIEAPRISTSMEAEDDGFDSEPRR